MGEVMGGAQVQLLTATPLKRLCPLKGGNLGGGGRGLGPRVPQHTYLQMIPASR